MNCFRLFKNSFNGTVWSSDLFSGTSSSLSLCFTLRCSLLCQQGHKYAICFWQSNFHFLFSLSSCFCIVFLFKPHSHSHLFRIFSFKDEPLCPTQLCLFVPHLLFFFFLLSSCSPFSSLTEHIFTPRCPPSPRSSTALRFTLHYSHTWLNLITSSSSFGRFRY